MQKICGNSDCDAAILGDRAGRYCWRTLPFLVASFREVQTKSFSDVVEVKRSQRRVCD